MIFFVNQKVVSIYFYSISCNCKIRNIEVFFYFAE